MVATESGFEIVVGGNGGMKVRVAETLCRVATAEQVLAMCAAFLQMYREQARYQERTATWLERVGIDVVRRCLVDDPQERDALHARFLESQRGSQGDPWAERKPGAQAAHTFAALDVALESLPPEQSMPERTASARRMLPILGQDATRGPSEPFADARGTV